MTRCSEVKALFAAGEVGADASPLSCCQSGGYQMRTLFDGVFQVPLGHYLVATDRQPR